MSYYMNLHTAAPTISYVGDVIWWKWNDKETVEVLGCAMNYFSISLPYYYIKNTDVYYFLEYCPEIGAI